MRNYTVPQLKTKLSSIAGANDKAALQEVFVNVVYQSLIYGNNMPDHMLAIRNSEAPTAFKAALIKWLPLAFNKTSQVYEYSRTKAEKLRTSLGVELANDNVVISLDDFADLLPDVFAKADKRDKPAFNAAAYATKVAKQLGDAGVGRAADIADLLLLMLTNQDAVAIMAHAAIKGTVKADASKAA